MTAQDDTDVVPEGFSLIPAGTFLMGSPADEFGRDHCCGLKSDESQHEVTLTRSFYAQKTEITNRQMAEVMNWALWRGLVNVVDGIVLTQVSHFAS